MIPYNYFARTKLGTIATPPEDDLGAQTRHQRELEQLMTGESKEEKQHRIQRESAANIHEILRRLDSKK